MAKRKFSHADIVIVGAWNKSIINPIWLCKQFPSIIKNPTDIKSELLIGSSNIYRYTINDVVIEIGSDKLIVILEKETRDKLHFISKISSLIFSNLPHTPIIAVGHNFIYDLKKEEINTIDNLFDNDIYESMLKKINSENPIEQQVQFAFAYQDNRLNISFQNRTDSKIISFNYHYPVDTSEKTKNAISEFMSNNDDSKIKFSKLLEEK